ncbi:MAG: hypothetical protein ABL871_00010 [Terricaulis sp.]
MRFVQTLCVGLGLALVGSCDRIPGAHPNLEPQGASLVIEVDAAAAVDRQLEQMSEQMAGALRAASIRYNGRGVSDGTVRIRLVDPTDMPRATQALAPITGHMTLTELPDGLIEARPNEGYVAGAAEQLVQDSIPVIQRRLANLGVVEAYAPGQLIIRTRQQSVPAQVRARLQQQGQLTFHMVRELSADEIGSGVLPRNTILAPPFMEGPNAEAVERQPQLTGEHLASATPSTDAQTGQWVLSFALDAEGTRLFCRITREHTGKRFAILLDNRVLTAPTINEPICGGSGQISGNFDAETVNDLSIILSTALPAPFHIVEELPPAAP